MHGGDASSLLDRDMSQTTASQLRIALRCEQQTGSHRRYLIDAHQSSRLCERGASVALTVPRHHGVGCEANSADCLHLFYTYSRYFFTDLASASLLSTDRIDYCTGGSMDIVWLALLGALFLLLIGLTVGCERLIPRRK